MQNNKNIQILEDGYEQDKTTNCNCSRLLKISTIQAPLCSLHKEFVVSNRPTNLNSLFKQILLDENLRENFLKGGTIMKFNPSNFDNTSFLINHFIIHGIAPLPYAEQLIFEVSC